MENKYLEKTINYLAKYRNIISVIESKKLTSELSDLDILISKLQDEITTSSNNEEKKGYKESDKVGVKQKEKVSFEEIIRLYKENKLDEIKGVKLDYKKLSDENEVTAFFQKYSKAEIIKRTTILDLNLLYFIFTQEGKEIKKKKDEVYDIIAAYIKAKRQGEAFHKTL